MFSDSVSTCKFVALAPELDATKGIAEELQLLAMLGIDPSPAEILSRDISSEMKYYLGRSYRGCHIVKSG